MTKPVLHVFAISHYCEKARWALDYLEIDYEFRHLPPGVHISIARKLSATQTALPDLLTSTPISIQFALQSV